MDTHEKAERARALLEDVVFQEALAGIRERQHVAFESSPVNEPELREQAHQMLRAITAIETELQSFVDDLAMQKGRHRAND